MVRIPKAGDEPNESTAAAQAAPEPESSAATEAAATIEGETPQEDLRKEERYGERPHSADMHSADMHSADMHSADTHSAGATTLQPPRLPEQSWRPERIALSPLRPRREGTPPNEFTFGWGDVNMEIDSAEIDSAESNSAEIDSAGTDSAGTSSAESNSAGIKNAPKSAGVANHSATARQTNRAAGKSPRQHASRGVREQPTHPQTPAAAPVTTRIPQLAWQLARQAAECTDRVGAAGLAAASATVALEASNANRVSIQRLTPLIAHAAAWIAWRLHGQPRLDRTLCFLPVAVQHCIGNLLLRNDRGEALTTNLVAKLLYRAARAASAEQKRTPQTTLRPGSLPTGSRRPRTEEW